MAAKLKGNKTFLIVGLSVVVAIPLLIVTFVIGKAALWLWLGLFIGALYVSWDMKRRRKKQQQEKDKAEARLGWQEFVDEFGVIKK